MSNRTISSLVLELLIAGGLSHKAIALEVRKAFPDAVTTDKSVASLKRDFKKAGKLSAQPAGEEASSDEADPNQLSMFPILDADEFQPALL